MGTSPKQNGFNTLRIGTQDSPDYFIWLLERPFYSRDTFLDWRREAKITMCTYLIGDETSTTLDVLLIYETRYISFDLMQFL